VSTIPRPDPFVQAHLDGVRAVHTFLPSLAPKPPAPPPQPPPAVSPTIKEGMRVASLARHVEQASARVARGFPPQPPPPPSPQEQFPGELDPVHIRAISDAIAAHPETQRAPLIHEAHQNLVKWIASKNGQIVHDGKMQIADSPKSAEQLAARIINEAVDDHDQRQADKQATLADAAGQKSGVDNSGPASADGGGSGVRPTNMVSDSGSVDRGVALPVFEPLPVGTQDPASGRTITQPTSDLDSAQELATAAAPELKARLKGVADRVKGANVDGVRDTKHPDRVQQKVDGEGKPPNTISDLLAGRVAVDSPAAKDQAVAAIKGSMPVVDEEDNFQKGDPDYGFRSHTLQAGLSNGATAEVQVVPQEIADADEHTHDTYEKGRQAEIDGDTDTANKAMATNRAAHDDAMQDFEDRNQPPDLRSTLEKAGFKVAGEPIKIGGKLFVAVNE
jgi:hypothetical protein